VGTADLGFLCYWCSYTGADLAGTSRIHYPANIHIIRVMCSARIDPTFVLKALAQGAGRISTHLEECLEEIDKIARLVEDLLLLARADAGVLRMDQRPVDLGQLVDEVYGQARILAEARSIHLRLGPAEPVSTQGDYAHLRRLLLNIVDNGIKYTPPGGKVTLSLQSSGGWASIQVADTGIGIPQEDQALLMTNAGICSQNMKRTNDAKNYFRMAISMLESANVQGEKSRIENILALIYYNDNYK
jgi:signal transduction histidine kinase